MSALFGKHRGKLGEQTRGVGAIDVVVVQVLERDLEAKVAAQRHAGRRVGVVERVVEQVHLEIDVDVALAVAQHELRVVRPLAVKDLARRERRRRRNVERLLRLLERRRIKERQRKVWIAGKRCRGDVGADLDDMRAADLGVAVAAELEIEIDLVVNVGFKVVVLVVKLADRDL